MLNCRNLLLDMRTLACKDLGLKHCDFVASGETIHEVLELMVDHIEDNHLEEWGRREEKIDLEQEKDLLVEHMKDDGRSPI